MALFGIRIRDSLEYQDSLGIVYDPFRNTSNSNGDENLEIPDAKLNGFNALNFQPVATDGKVG